jgi:hypothetical protein
MRIQKAIQDEDPKGHPFPQNMVAFLSIW